MHIRSARAVDDRKTRFFTSWYDEAVASAAAAVAGVGAVVGFGCVTYTLFFLTLLNRSGWMCECGRESV